MAQGQESGIGSVFAFDNLNEAGVLNQLIQSGVEFLKVGDAAEGKVKGVIGAFKIFRRNQFYVIAEFQFFALIFKFGFGFYHLWEPASS